METIERLRLFDELLKSKNLGVIKESSFVYQYITIKEKEPFRTKKSICNELKISPDTLNRYANTLKIDGLVKKTPKKRAKTPKVTVENVKTKQKGGKRLIPHYSSPSTDREKINRGRKFLDILMLKNKNISEDALVELHNKEYPDYKINSVNDLLLDD